MRFIRRSPRKKLHCPALLTRPDEQQEIVDVVEISVHGAAFVSAARPTSGQRVTLLLDPGALYERGLPRGLPTLAGVVINAMRSSDMADGRVHYLVGVDFAFLPPDVVADLRRLTDAPAPPASASAAPELPAASHLWSFRDQERAYQMAYAAVEARDFRTARALLGSLRRIDPINPSCRALECHIAAEEALDSGDLDDAAEAVARALTYMPHASDLGDLATRISRARSRRPERKSFIKRLFGGSEPS